MDTPGCRAKAPRNMGYQLPSIRPLLSGPLYLRVSRPPGPYFTPNFAAIAVKIAVNHGCLFIIPYYQIKRPSTRKVTLGHEAHPSSTLSCGKYVR